MKNKHLLEVEIGENKVLTFSADGIAIGDYTDKHSGYKEVGIVLGLGDAGLRMRLQDDDIDALLETITNVKAHNKKLADEQLAATLNKKE